MAHILDTTLNNLSEKIVELCDRTWPEELEMSPEEAELSRQAKQKNKEHLLAFVKRCHKVKDKYLAAKTNAERQKYGEELQRMFKEIFIEMGWEDE